MKRIIIVSLFVLFCGCVTKPLDKEVIDTKSAPAAIGPYSQAIRVGNTIYLAGQLAIDPATGKMIEGGIDEQTHQVLKNIQAVLDESDKLMYEQKKSTE